MVGFLLPSDVGAGVSAGFVGRGTFVGGGALVGGGSFVGGGAFVGGGTGVLAGGGSVTLVGAGDGGIGVVARVGATLVCVGTGEAPELLDLGDRNVLIGDRNTGVIAVAVVIGVPVPGRGQGCRATGNNKQLEASEQIFKLKLVDCAPLQTSIRLPFTTSAVRQETGELDSTSKSAASGKIKTAWAKLFTQN